MTRRTYTPAQKAQKLKRQAARREARAAAGLCVTCGDPTEGGNRQCEGCRAEANARNKRNHTRKMKRVQAGKDLTLAQARLLRAMLARRSWTCRTLAIQHYPAAMRQWQRCGGRGAGGYGVAATRGVSVSLKRLERAGLVIRTVHVGARGSTKRIPPTWAVTAKARELLNRWWDRYGQQQDRMDGCNLEPGDRVRESVPRVCLLLRGTAGPQAGERLQPGEPEP